MSRVETYRSTFVYFDTLSTVLHHLETNFTYLIDRIWAYFWKCCVLFLCVGYVLDNILGPHTSLLGLDWINKHRESVLGISLEMIYFCLQGEPIEIFHRVLSFRKLIGIIGDTIKGFFENLGSSETIFSRAGEVEPLNESLPRAGYRYSLRSSLGKLC